MDLEYSDLCTIVDLDRQIIDQDSGDTDNVFICFNQPCDFQPEWTENRGGTLVAHNPKLFLPYDFPLTDELSRNLTIIISRFRKIMNVETFQQNDDGGFTFTLIDEEGKHQSFHTIPAKYSSGAKSIDFEKDYRQGNADKKHLVVGKIEDWWEINTTLGMTTLDGIEIELREITYL